MTYSVQHSQTASQPAQVCVAQLGKRAEYFVPRLLQQSGMLAHLYTDACAIGNWSRLLRSIPEQVRPPALQRLIRRVPEGVAEDNITAFNLFGLEYSRRRAAARTQAEMTAAHIWAGETFCRLVLRRGFKDANALFTYTSAGLEIMTTARRAGLRTVMEQLILPIGMQHTILQEEADRFPAWQEGEQDDAMVRLYGDREKAEWANADTIICGSEFLRDGIVAYGAPAERCVVIPYGMELSLPFRYRDLHGGPLRVLTIGGGLRKGAPYVLEAAKRLRGAAEFRLVGHVGSQQVAPQVGEYIDTPGMVSRAELLDHFAWADVFLLPTPCEGSPLAIYEALNCGLPVICTPNAGSVVRDNLDGFIIPIRDPDSIVDRLERLAASPDLRREMSRNAYEQGQRFGPETYKQRMLVLFQS